MENKPYSSRQYWKVMQNMINRLEDLTEKVEKMGGAQLSLEKQHPSAQLDPLALLDRKLKELNEHIRQYAGSSMELYLNLKKIDKELPADTTLLAERPVMLTELGRLTTRVVMDIRMKRAFLRDFIEPVQSYSNVCIMEYAGMLEEVREVCSEYLLNLDLMVELILACSKYSSTALASSGPDLKRMRRRKVLQKVTACINAETDRRFAAGRISEARGG